MAGWRACLLMVAACETAGRAPVGDASGSAYPACGNGRIDPGLFFSGERCDDGSANGQVGSTCTLECDLLPTELSPLQGGVDLQFVPTQAANILFYDAEAGGIALLDSSANRLAIVREFFTESVHTPWIHLSRQDPIISVAAVGTPEGVVPMWIEQSSDRAFHLYAMDIAQDGTQTIAEFPYPFPEGTTPRLRLEMVQGGSRVAVTLIDQSASSSAELYVAMLAIGRDHALRVSSVRVPAPGGTLGPTGIFTWDDQFPTTASSQPREIVQFFVSPPSFVAFVDRAEPEANTQDVDTAFSLQETGRGTLPWSVVDALPWDESYNPQRCSPSGTEAPPIANLTDTGAVYIWRYPQTISGEDYLSPFARFKAGSPYLFSSDNELYVIEPDGEEAAARDSSCRDLRSPSMGVVRGPGIPAWSNAVRGYGMQSLGSEHRFMTFDSKLYWW